MSENNRESRARIRANWQTAREQGEGFLPEDGDGHEDDTGGAQADGHGVNGRAALAAKELARAERATASESTCESRHAAGHAEQQAMNGEHPRAADQSAAHSPRTNTPRWQSATTRQNRFSPGLLVGGARGAARGNGHGHHGERAGRRGVAAQSDARKR